MIGILSRFGKKTHEEIPELVLQRKLSTEAIGKVLQATQVQSWLAWHYHRDVRLTPNQMRAIGKLVPDFLREQVGTKGEWYFSVRTNMPDNQTNFHYTKASEDASISMDFTFKGAIDELVEKGFTSANLILEPPNGWQNSGVYVARINQLPREQRTDKKAYELELLNIRLLSLDSNGQSLYREAQRIIREVITNPKDL